MKEKLETTNYHREIGGQKHSTEEEWTPIECFRCGVCCTGYYPKVSKKEIKFMAKQLSMSSNEFIGKYIKVTQIGYLLRQTENGCVFLTREKGTSKTSCSIYAFRPSVCRNLVPSLSNPRCQEGLAKLKNSGS